MSDLHIKQRWTLTFILQVIFPAHNWVWRHEYVLFRLSNTVDKDKCFSSADTFCLLRRLYPGSNWTVRILKSYLILVSNSDSTLAQGLRYSHRNDFTVALHVKMLQPFSVSSCPLAYLSPTQLDLHCTLKALSSL